MSEEELIERVESSLHTMQHYVAGNVKELIAKLKQLQSHNKSLAADVQFVRSQRPIARALEESRDGYRALLKLIDRSDAGEFTLPNMTPAGQIVSISRSQDADLWFVYVDGTEAFQEIEGKARMFARFGDAMDEASEIVKNGCPTTLAAKEPK